MLVREATVRSSGEVVMSLDEEGDGVAEEEERRRDHDYVLVDVAADLDVATVWELNVGGVLDRERIEEEDGKCDNLC